MLLGQNSTDVADLGSIAFGDHRGIPWTTISGTAPDTVALKGVVGLIFVPTFAWTVPQGRVGVKTSHLRISAQRLVVDYFHF
jgi:hypothetical protein